MCLGANTSLQHRGDLTRCQYDPAMPPGCQLTVGVLRESAPQLQQCHHLQSHQQCNCNELCLTIT